MNAGMNNTVDSAAHLGMQLATPLKVEDSGIPYAVVPAGATLQSLEKFLLRPVATTINHTFTRAQSLIQFANRFKNEAMTVSFCEQRNTFLVRVDDDLPDRPSWRSHSGSLTLKYSPEATAWFDGAGKAKARNQEDFALFIEDHMLDIVEPKGADMLAMVLEFKSSSTASFSSAMRLSDGNVQVSYAVESKPGTVSFPERLKIYIPIFHGQPRTPIDLRVRYRVHEAKLLLWYEIVGKEALLLQQIEQYVAQIEAGVGLPVLFRAC